MSVAAVMLVKDEADVIEPVIQHLAANVDAIYVSDNASTDGTRDQLEELRKTLPVHLQHDPDPAYYQSAKTTALAMKAFEDEHRWVIPCDADEIWITGDGRPLRDYLAGMSREIQFVKAAIYNHCATALDPPARDLVGLEGAANREAVVEAFDLTPEPNPFKRIGWHQRAHLDMRWGKVACRLRPDLEIHQGNHSASTQGVGTTGYGLEIRHFPYRSADHFIRKAINGYAAYKATDLDEGTGAHWRVYGKAIEEGGPEAGAAWFYDAFWSEDPEADDSLVYDPAPIAE